MVWLVYCREARRLRARLTLVLRCRLSDVDECALSGAAAVCKNGGTCTNTDGGFSCKCSEAFSGFGALTCESGGVCLNIDVKLSLSFLSLFFSLFFLNNFGMNLVISLCSYDFADFGGSWLSSVPGCL